MTKNRTSLPIKDVIDRIITINTHINEFWSSSHGWAPLAAAEILSKSRLDWQVSLSYSLYRWIEPPSSNESSAVQILAYANLGALVEGTLKLFLSVYYQEYKQDVNKIIKNGEILCPDRLGLENIRQFFQKTIWGDEPRENWDPWIARIQYRRNAIHAYKDRSIGKHKDILNDINFYLKFLWRINLQLPYPDGHEGPPAPSVLVSTMEMEDIDTYAPEIG